MKKNTGDRIIQIVLLVVIAAGLGSIALVMKPSGDGFSRGPGVPGMSGAPGGMGGPQGGMEQKETAIAVEAVEVLPQRIEKYIKVNGDVVSNVSVDIYSDVKGELTNLNVQLGSFVRKGDILALVDPSSPGAVYSQSEIPATISGTITAVNSSVGDKIQPSAAILTIGELSNLSVVTYVPERYITYLKKGLKAEVQLEAFPSVNFQAQVIQLNPVLDNVSRSMEIKLIFLNPDNRIKAGMFASMKLVTQERNNVLAVPLSSVEDYYDEKVVYVIDEQNICHRRSVTLGLASEELVEILSGLDENELVVSLGSSSITEGSLVKVVN